MCVPMNSVSIIKIPKVPIDKFEISRSTYKVWRSESEICYMRRQKRHIIIRTVVWCLFKTIDLNISGRVWLSLDFICDIYRIF